jgi:hypothetical protein
MNSHRRRTGRLALAVAAPERCTVLGNAKDAARIAGKLETARSVNATVIGRVALHRNDDDASATLS